jgi:Protein of unknown function (DUF2911)
MKKYSLVLIALFLLLPVAADAQYRRNDELHATKQAYDSPERVSPSRRAALEFGTGEIVLEWSAPSVRERQLLGNLVPTDNVWRTGANEATVIHFDDDVLVEGEPLAAGSYALFTIGGEKEWTVIFNSEAQQWGAFSRDPEKDVLTVKTAAGEGEHQEELLLSIVPVNEGNARVELAWGTLRTGFDVSLAKTE